MSNFFSGDPGHSSPSTEGLTELDSVTVVSSPALWLAKRIWPDRIEQYSRARNLNVTTIPAADLDDIRTMLGHLIGDPRTAVMRGELIDASRTRGIRRLLYPDRKTGERPTFREQPRRWLALDIEGIYRPETIPAADLAGCAALAIDTLPAVFSGVRCIVQASASHGIKPDIRLRLWFWLSRPTSGDELKRWLEGTPADPAVFSAVAPIYTARPIFEGGTIDPLPSRLAEMPGTDFVAVPSPATLAPPERARPSPGPQTPISDARLEAFRNSVLANLGRAGDGAKHRELVKASRALGGIQDQAGFGDQVAVDWLLEALPAGVDDLGAAEQTAVWGLEAGRAKPIVLEDRPRTPRSNGATPPPYFDELPPHPGYADRPEPPRDSQAGQAGQSGTPPPRRGQAFGRLLMLGMGDIDTAAPRGYLLKGLLSPNEISLWVGPPKCGKSFLLLHVAYLLSLGRSVFGRRVKPTVVLYVAAEGEAGIANRIRALRDKYGPSDNFHFIAQPADLLHEAGHKLELIDAATACGAELIVLDTLSRLMAGGDENSSQDMGLFISAVADIRFQTRAHVALVHHGTKASNGVSPRGHSSLTGADDALIEVTKLEDGTRLATVVHAKDDAGGMRWGFTLDRVQLGTDEDGDPITTLRVVENAEVPERAERAAPISDNLQIGLKTLHAAMKAHAVLATVGEDHAERSVITELDWRTWFYREGKPGETQDTKKKAFQRTVTGLLARGLIGSRDGFIWPEDGKV
jgi:hypothetical protein